MIKSIARWKNYLSRTQSYLLVLTFGFSLRTYFTDWKIIPAFLLGIGGMLFLGYMDYKLGLFKAEQDHTSKQNPLLVEIDKNVRSLCEEVRKR